MADDPVSPSSHDPHRTIAYPVTEAAPEALPALGTVDEYDLVRELGRGAQGVVYVARHRRLGRFVALKMFLGGVLSDDFRRLHREAEVTALLDHPNIVPVYHVGEHEGRPFFTMKLIEGSCIAEELPRFMADPRAAAGLVACLARAVHHAHQRGVLHRDIKPSNVLLGLDGEPYVTDFGLARRLHGGQELTHHGAVLGTPAYMAPEQTGGGQPTTTAADVYGLGALLYAMLTGRPPFLGDDLLDTLTLVRDALPVAPSTLNPHIEADLERVCLKALEKEPERRYHSAEELAEDLERYLRREEVQARPMGGVERLGRWAERHPARATIVVMSIALLGLIALSVRSYFEVRAEQARYAHELARSANERFQLVAHAVGITSAEPELRRILAEPDSPQRRARAQAFLNATRSGFNKWFTWSSEEPLVNWFVLDEHGTIIADSRPDSQAVGKNFRKRDYARLLDEPDGEETDLSAVFHSHQDGMYKFCVCTRIRNEGRCVGLLAAAVPISGRMLGLNMIDHPNGAAVVGPMDTSYPAEDGEHGPDQRWAVVLSRSYLEADQEMKWISGEAGQLLDRFGADPALREGRCLEGGKAVDAVRVGGTRYVAVLPHPLPWPVGLMSPTGWLIFFAALTTGAVVVWLVLRRGRVVPTVEVRR